MPEGVIFGIIVGATGGLLHSRARIRQLRLELAQVRELYRLLATKDFGAIVEALNLKCS